MDISEVKYNLNKRVRLAMPRIHIDAEYFLTGCILRRKKTGEFFYQAELQDLNTKSLVISDLRYVSKIKQEEKQ